MKLFKKILVALVSAALLSAPFAASALTLDNVESSEEYVPTVVGDDGLTDTEWLKQQASEKYSSEFMSVLETYAELEVTPFNVRRVIDLLGQEAYFADSYSCNEELMAYFDNYSMNDIVWNLAGSADASLFAMDWDANGDRIPDGRTKAIRVVRSSTTDASSFIVTYGDTTYNVGDSIAYAEGNSLLIKPADSRIKITSAQITLGMYWLGNIEGNPELVTDGSKFIKTDGSVEISAQYFDVADANAEGFYPELNRRSYVIEITVTTEPAPAGDIFLEEKGGSGATYSVTTTSTATGNLTTIQNAINNLASNNAIAVGTHITFTVDSGKIASVTVNGVDTTIANNTFSIDVGSGDINIVFTYKSTAKFNVDQTGDFTGVTYTASVRSNGTLYNIAANDNATTLAEELSKYYAGDIATITVNVPAGSNLGTVSYGSVGALTPNGNVLTLTLEAEATLSLNFTKIAPIVNVYEYQKALPVGATNYDKFVVARITNYDKLTATKIDNAYFMVTNAKLGGNPNKDDYEDGQVDAGRTDAYFAMGFTPKMEDGYHFTSTFDVTAYVEYDGKGAVSSNTITVTLDKSITE